MGSAVVFGVLLLFLLLILAGMLRGLDWEALSRTEGGLLSKSGVRAVVGGGFIIGLAYGLFVGSQGGSATWMWVSRGVIDGLVVACAGAFYLGYQQRRTMRGTAKAEGTAGAVESGLGPHGEVDTAAGASAAAEDEASTIAQDPGRAAALLSGSPGVAAESAQGAPEAGAPEAGVPGASESGASESGAPESVDDPSSTAIS